MTARLLIIGAGGFGREILAWAEDVVRATPSPEWTIGGFLDANPLALKAFNIDVPVVGDPSSYMPQPNDRFVCAIGDPATKLRVCEALRGRGAQFTNLIHPTALVGPRCQLGTGAILCPFAALTVDVTLGDFVTLNLRAGVGHDVRIGDGATLNAYCDVTGAARLGKGVFMGSHAVVAPKAVVEDFARIGAGSVVVRRVKAGSSVIGVPAKRIDFDTVAAPAESAKAA